jgi:hypothetical protein
MRLGQEAEQIDVAHCLDDLRAPWKLRQDLRRREWNVEEQADAPLMPPRAKEPTCEQQVVVMDPHRRIAMHELERMHCVALVGGDMGVPVAVVAHHPIRKAMEQRP